VHPHGHRLQGLRLQQRRQVLGTEWLVHGSAVRSAISATVGLLVYSCIQIATGVSI